MSNYIMTPEHKAKIGLANKGRYVGKTLSEEHKAKIRATSKISGEKKKLLTGPLAPGWKGGISVEDKRQRSIFTRTIKPLVLLRDDHTCQRCGTKDGKMHVDHIQSWKDFKHLRLEMSNCRTLCMACHYLITYNRPIPEGVTWGNR